MNAEDRIRPVNIFLLSNMAFNTSAMLYIEQQET